MYRLYMDEVGTDSLTHVDKDKHRYLSLTGLVIDIQHSATKLEPNMNWIKANILKHDPDDPIILHRTDILGRKGQFSILNSEDVCARFDASILRLAKSTEFTAITAFIDKQAMLKKHNWRQKEPYLYLMQIMVEKYVQFLERKGSIGDIMPEARGNPKDASLQAAYTEVRSKGTYYVPKVKMESYLRAANLKFRTKKDNIAGLQLCDLFAHPSHIYARKSIGHDVNPGVFGEKMIEILVSEKYDRSKNGHITGYGVKIAS